VYVARAIVVPSRRRPAGSDACLLHVYGGPGIVIYSGRTPVLALTLHLALGIAAAAGLMPYFTGALVAHLRVPGVTCCPAVPGWPWFRQAAAGTV
jgi:hypothetical protein